MADASTSTTQLQHWLRRLEHRDGEALDHLIAHASIRLERLTRHMLRSYPGVRRWEQTADVLQGALMRLVRALHEVYPTTTRDFLALAGLQIRRELIDLARHYQGPHGLGANYASHDGHANRPDDRADDPVRIAQWAEFHAKVDDLPGDQRDVMELLFYQGLSQTEAAGLLNISTRTVQRRWQSALLSLHPILNATA